MNTKEEWIEAFTEVALLEAAAGRRLIGPHTPIN